MRKEPTCPYCGCEMVYPAMGCQYECPHCCSKGPDSNDPEEAYVETVQRYEPPVRPLTWEDAIADDCYLERRGDKYVDVALNTLAMSTDGPKPGLRDCIHFVTHSEEDVKLMRADYGKTWRCWARRPTDEERSSAAWINL